MYSDCDVTLFGTGEMYGAFTNEVPLGEALAPVRHHVVIVTSFANELGPIGEKLGLNIRPEHIKVAVEGFMPKHRAHRFVPHANLGGDLG